MSSTKILFPIVLGITIENENDLIELYHRLNMPNSFLKDYLETMEHIDRERVPFIGIPSGFHEVYALALDLKIDTLKWRDDGKDKK